MIADHEKITNIIFPWFVGKSSSPKNRQEKTLKLDANKKIFPGCDLFKKKPLASAPRKISLHNLGFKAKHKLLSFHSENRERNGF